jgi:hypothetical protein
LAVAAGPDEAATDPILDKMFRSMERPGYEHKFDRLLARLSVVDDGDGSAVVMDVDFDRISRSVIRIARSLYFLETGSRVPPEARWQCKVFGAVHGQSPESVELLKSAIREWRKPPRGLDSREFLYLSVIESKRSWRATWFMEFYGKTQFLVGARLPF